ncbi:28S ribosomal protein S18a, mitochondrial [Spodoptera frugiperda]|uniref:Large ribosomal subunit protein mL66 n=1 Tax=Spodoptera frugiperda TaxID=7108 RepID=A0A9R0EK55_SPOFR|nr:28S ribosomal protein S18a, mitochondrial [Spodoptera frugiperda]
MAGLVRAGFSFARNAIFSTSVRSIATTNPLNLKEIRERTEGSSIVIEAVNVPSPRTELLVRAENLPNHEPAVSPSEKPPCYMCALGLDVKHTDVLILSQFVRSDGCMLPRRITGLCRRQQKKMGKLVTMAQKAGLMINLTPGNCKKDPKKRREHKKFNTYFDERTIFMKKIPKPVDRFKR